MPQCDTGHGATITLSESALSLNWKNIDLGEETLDEIDKTHLGSARKQMEPGDIPDDGEITIPFQWEVGANAIVTGTKETATITFSNGGTTAAPIQSTFTATGWIKRIKRPNFQTNQINEGEITFRIDGSAAPVYA